MRRHTIDYKRRDGGRYWTNVGVFLSDIPRLRLWCRLFGHRPIVDGTTLTRSHNPEHRPARWVVCDRCGVRPEPQGSLDPDVWNIGDRYDGPSSPLLPSKQAARSYAEQLQSLKERPTYPPGPFPTRPTGEVGWQFVAGRHHMWAGAGFNAKVGNKGSEHTLALDLHLVFVSLYLWTERFGLGLVHRLNPTSMYSREIGLRLVSGRLEWKLWAVRDNPKNDERWWQRGQLSLRWRDKLLGPRRYDYQPVPGAEVARVVRMPEGDYLVNLRLERVTFGRRRWRKHHSYSVDWAALGQGIPTKGPLRGRICGSGVTVPPLSVDAGTWPAEAVAAITKQITRHRTSHGWEPTGLVPVDREGAVA